MAKSNGSDNNPRKKAVKSPAGQPEKAQTTAGALSAAAPKADGGSQIHAVTTMRPRPTREEMNEAIRRRAYELYCERGQQGGNPEEDWQRAEQEVLRQYGQRSA